MASWMHRRRSIRSLSSRRYDSRCSSRPVVGHRGDREERLLALVERSGRREHRAAERAQERRRPADVERLVGHADQVAFRAERLDPGGLRATPVEEVVGRRVLGGDRVEDAADQRALVVGARPVAGTRSATLAGQPDHLGPDRDVLPLGRGQDPLGRQASDRIVWRIFRAKRSRPSRASPSLAGRTTSRRCVSNAASAARATSAAARSRGRHRGHRRIVRGRLGLGERVVDQRGRRRGAG